MVKLQSWEVSDALWKKVAPLVPQKERNPNQQYIRKPGGGRKSIDARTVFSGIVFVLRTGIQWKAIPKEQYGSPSAIHRYFLEWMEAGFFGKLWKKGIAELDELEGISWEWQSADSSSVKAPLAQESVGPNPTDRGKEGTKRHLKCDGNGIPLSICVTGANRHDSPVLGELLIRSIVSQIPREIEENLCLDKGYFGKPSENLCEQHGYKAHIRSRGEENKTRKESIENGEDPEPNRRWVVERTNGWLNRFRKLLIRFEKKTSSYEALLELACAIITYRQYI